MVKSLFRPNAGFVAFFAFLIFSALAYFPAAAMAGNFSAELVDVSGPVFVIYGGMPGKSPARKGLKLVPGDTVETGKGGEAEILYGDGNVSRLDEESRFVIDKLEINEGVSRETILKLELGRVKNAVSKLVNKQTKFEVHTASAVAGVTGTPPWVVGLVGSPGSMTTEVDLLGKAGEPGEVFVTGAGSPERHLLSPGTRSMVEFGKLPKPPFSIAPDRFSMLETRMPIRTPMDVRQKLKDQLDNLSKLKQEPSPVPPPKSELKQPDVSGASSTTPVEPAGAAGKSALGSVTGATGSVAGGAAGAVGGAAAGAAGALAGAPGAAAVAGGAVAAGTVAGSGGAALGMNGKKAEPAAPPPAKAEEKTQQPAPAAAGEAVAAAAPAAATAQARIMTAAGSRFTLFLKPDGIVWGVGYNDDGQLGDNSDDKRKIPVITHAPGGVGKLEGVVAIAAGYRHSVAVRNDGTAVAWGYNNYGQLGDNTDDNRLYPVSVKGPKGKGKLEGVAAVAAGQDHSLALKKDGTVWAWGSNGEGQLGDDTGDDSEAPVQVKGLSGVVAIAAGTAHSMALKADGTVWTWGKNESGQLGDKTITSRKAPVQVKGPDGRGKLTDVAGITAGKSFSGAVKKDGTVWTWGNNSRGQLGIGSNSPRLAPINVEAISDVAALAAGPDFILALKKDGTVWGWGYNDDGQLGDNTSKTRQSPVQVLGPQGKGFLAGAVAIAAGENHSLAILNSGPILAWGRNNKYQLGDGSGDDTETPVRVKLP